MNFTGIYAFFAGMAMITGFGTWGIVVYHFLQKVW